MNKHKSAKPRPELSANGNAGRFSKAKVLAARIGIHPKTLFRWADAGLIHRHKVNDRVVLFDEDEIFEFIASSRVGGTGRAA